MSNIILFGSGAAGRYALRHLRSKGIEPLCFVDNDHLKQRGKYQGVLVMRPGAAKEAYPSAEWVACAISRPAATEIRAQLSAMGVKTKPLWECIPVCHGLPPEGAWDTVLRLANDSDADTINFLWDQHHFRKHPDYDRQCDPVDCKDIYFPDFIQHRDDEHFIDGGGGDGDTIKLFIEHWSSYSQITVFEPDPSNMKKIREATHSNDRVIRFDKALSDYMHTAHFSANGDYSSHLNGDGQQKVECWKLDDLYARETDHPPTYIKFDIEGSEVEALWGARRILKELKPVLAICAYHTSDHLWEIPLLIHAIQPDYRLYFRRYAEGAFETVWYAVPSERIL